MNERKSEIVILFSKLSFLRFKNKKQKMCKNRIKFQPDFEIENKINY